VLLKCICDKVVFEHAQCHIAVVGIWMILSHNQHGFRADVYHLFMTFAQGRIATGGISVYIFSQNQVR